MARTKLCVQHYVTGRNVSFNQFLRQEGLLFFSGKLFYQKS